MSQRIRDGYFNKETSNYLNNLIETYYEFPPLWAGPFRSQNGSLLDSIRQRPLLDNFEAERFLKKFVNLKGLKLQLEAGKYTFFTYVKIKNTFKEATYENIKLNTEYQLVTTAWFSKCIANQMIKNNIIILL